MTASGDPQVRAPNPPDRRRAAQQGTGERSSGIVNCDHEKNATANSNQAPGFQMAGGGPARLRSTDGCSFGVRARIMIPILRIIGDVHAQIDHADLFTCNARPYLDIIADAGFSVQLGDMGDRGTYEQLVASVDAGRHRFSLATTSTAIGYRHITLVILATFSWEEWSSSSREARGRATGKS